MYEYMPFCWWFGASNYQNTDELQSLMGQGWEMNRSFGTGSIEDAAGTNPKTCNFMQLKRLKKEGPGAVVIDPAFVPPEVETARVRIPQGWQPSRS